MTACARRSSLLLTISMRSSNFLFDVRKERKNLEREVGYLNDVLAEQTAELKKMSMHQDERAVASLIRTYE